MPRRAAQPTNYAVDEASSESDQELEDNTNETRAKSVAASKGGTKKRGRGESAASKTNGTQNKARVKTVQDGSQVGTKSSNNPKQVATKEIPSTQAVSDNDELDEFALDAPNETRALSTPMSATRQRTSVDAPAAPPNAASESPVRHRAGRGRPAKRRKEEVPETQIADTATNVQASSNFGRTQQKEKPPRPMKRQAVQETQADEMNVEDDGSAAEETAVPNHKRARKAKLTDQARSERHTVEKEPETREDLDSTRPSPALKRRLEELSKKFEALDLRYQDLRNVGVNEAKQNFDQLKQVSNERAKASDDLISNLRAELAAQKANAAESIPLRSEISNLNSWNENLKTEKASLEKALNSAQSEVRTLQAKLQTTRSNSEQRAVPNSAAKNSAKSKQLPTVAEDPHQRALKEDLYGDLTGLIIRSVKKREEDSMDVYDCIQAGRNGTLHFHLALPNPVPPGTAYGDAEFEYSPLLDTAHDRNLIDILPDYLTEEIVFPQKEAPRFYSRINEFIMKTRPMEPVSDDEMQDNDDATSVDDG